MRLLRNLVFYFNRKKNKADFIEKLTHLLFMLELQLNHEFIFRRKINFLLQNTLLFLKNFQKTKRKMK
jgi:hypothetical protein